MHFQIKLENVLKTFDSQSLARTFRGKDSRLSFVTLQKPRQMLTNCADYNATKTGHVPADLIVGTPLSV